MNYWHVRITFAENVDIILAELTKRLVAGFGCVETLSRTGDPVAYHAHFLIYTDERIIKNLRNALSAAGVRGNKLYSIEKMRKTYEHLSAYVCKQYTPEHNCYRWGIEYTPEVLQSYKDAWDAGFDAKKAAGGKNKKSDAMLEELCDGLDSTSSKQMIARNVWDYTIKHFDETRFWSDERCRALVNSVHRQLNSHDLAFRARDSERWSVN